MADLSEMEKQYRKQHPEATDIYADADVPGTIKGAISSLGDTLGSAGETFKGGVTPPGGFKKGASPGYRIGEGIEQGAKTFVQGAEDVGSFIYNNSPQVQKARFSGEVIKGLLGLDPGRGLTDQALEKWDGQPAQPATPSGSPSKAPAAKAPGKQTIGAGPRPGVTPRPLLNNPWQQGGVPMRALQGGIYASGQDLAEGESPYYEWSRTNNGQIEKVMLPAGVDPTKLSKEQLATFKPYTENPADTGEGVRVVRGLREFKGGKEVDDGRATELRTKDTIRMMGEEMDRAANPAGRQEGFTGQRIPTDPSAMQGVVSEMLKGQSQERQQEIASASAERQQRIAAGATIGAAKLGAGKDGKIEMTSIKFRDPNNPLGGETSIPVAHYGNGVTEYMIPGMHIIQSPSGIIVPPEIAKDPLRKKAYLDAAQRLMDMITGTEEKKKED